MLAKLEPYFAEFLDTIFHTVIGLDLNIQMAQCGTLKVCEKSLHFTGKNITYNFSNDAFSVIQPKGIDGMHDTNQNINRMNVTFNFTDISLKRIFCFAPVWNSTEWVNQSTNFQMIKGISPSKV